MKKILIIAAVGLLAALSVFAALRIIGKRQVNKAELTPRKAEAIRKYAEKELETKDLDKAKRAYEILASDTREAVDKPDAILKLAEISEANNNFIEAARYYRQFISQYPSSEAVADAHKKLGDMNVRVLFSPTITDTDVKYEIKEGDTLGKISKDNNVTVALLKRCNNLENEKIMFGRVLKVPKGVFSIVVDKSQNVLLLKMNGEVFKTYEVSTGENNSTPTGKFVIEEKLISPPWYKVNAVVPADKPEYELGTRWMGLSVQGYGIHGTKDPGSIGRQVTKGCVRMRNEEIEELYDIVPSGTEVVIGD